MKTKLKKYEALRTWLTPQRAAELQEEFRKNLSVAGQNEESAAAWVLLNLNDSEEAKLNELINLFYDSELPLWAD
jgi:hypothetical protein